MPDNFNPVYDLMWEDILTYDDPRIAKIVERAIKDIHLAGENRIETICRLNHSLSEVYDLSAMEIQEILWFVDGWRIDNHGGYLPDEMVCLRCDYRIDLCICGSSNIQ